MQRFGRRLGQLSSQLAQLRAQAEVAARGSDAAVRCNKWRLQWQEDREQQGVVLILGPEGG